MKNLGTGVMMVAAALVEGVIVILPHNPIISINNTSNMIQTPLNPELSENNLINTDTANSLILNVNAYSSTIFQDHNIISDLQYVTFSDFESKIPPEGVC